MRTTYRQLACRILRVLGPRVRVTPYSGRPINSAIVLIPELYGDTILMTPFLRALSSVAPSAQITVVGSGPGVRLLKHDSRVHETIDLRDTSSQERRALSGQTFDVLFSTKDHPSFTNLRLVRRIKASYRIGFNHPGHHGFFDHLVDRPEQMPVWEKTAGLVTPLVADSNSTEGLGPYMPDGPISPEVSEFVAEQMAFRRVIAVNLSASKAEKRWPIDRWEDLLSGVVGPIVVLAAPEHAADRLLLESRLPCVIPAPATTSLFDVGHIVKHAGFLVTTDTAAVHIASCFDTPVLALYRNPRDLAKFPPLSRVNQVLLAFDDNLASISVEKVRDGLDYFERTLPVSTSESNHG